MAGTVMLNVDLLPEFDDSADEVPIQVGPGRRVAHRGTFVPPDGEPVWPLADDYDLAKLPLQGQWTARDFLALGVGKAIELTYGRLEFLPVATARHQAIVLDLILTLRGTLKPGGRGTVLFAPFPMDTLPGKYREPDVLVMLAENAGRMSNESWAGADLAVEVVSEDDPARDYVAKRREYALCGVREYWIVDPLQKLILLLALDGDVYREVGTYRPGDSFASLLIDGLTVDVAAVFAAADAGES